MPITDIKKWNKCEEVNKDAYGKCCVDVARKVMEILDESPDKKIVGGYEDDFSTHKLICRADNEIKAGGITGFMAGCVAQMVSQCHSRGKEFREAWNLHNQINKEGEKANKKGAVLNPALLNINTD